MNSATGPPTTSASGEISFAVGSEHRKTTSPAYLGQEERSRLRGGVCATTTATQRSGTSIAASQLTSSLLDPKYSIKRRQAATKTRVSSAHDATSSFSC